LLERLTEPALEHRFATAHEARQALEERKNSRLTPVNRTKTLRKNSIKSYQRLDPHIVIKRKTNAILEIAIHRSVFKSSMNPFICFILMLFSGFLFSLWGIWGVFLGLVGVFRLFIAWDDKRLSQEPPLLGSIQLDRQGDRFVIQNRAVLQAKTGKISDIQYLSIHPTRVESIGTYNQITIWGITIRATDRYTLKWDLREEECIWLVNEIENWLNFDKTKG
jgi:hypothetical protein